VSFKLIQYNSKLVSVLFLFYFTCAYNPKPKLHYFDLLLYVEQQVVQQSCTTSLFYRLSIFLIK